MIPNPIKILHHLRPLRLWRRAWATYVAFHTLASFKVQLSAFLGIVGFPLFYVIHTWVLPQPYENAWLRAAAFLIALVLGASPFWPERFQRFLPAYSYVAFLLALPTFFTFMLLMNGANTSWQVSTLAAFVYVALLYDTINTVIVSIVGSLLGCAAFWFATNGAPFPDGYLTFLPVASFALSGLILLNYSDSRIADEKMQAASRLASHIAHEMRTPLLGIKFDAERVNSELPRLTEALEWALANGWDGRKLSRRKSEGLRTSMTRIRDHTQSANLVIDMLLVNAGQESLAAGAFDIHSARSVVKDAVDRYHFRPGEDAQLVLHCDDDFSFFGSDLLLVHTLFNLMKNALRALESIGGGKLEIRLVPGVDRNCIVVTDDGPGIAPDVLNRIFVPFYSGEKQGLGTGIGLAFSKYVVESFDGRLSCTSRLGSGASFAIALPVIESDADAATLQSRMEGRRRGL